MTMSAHFGIQAPRLPKDMQRTHLEAITEQSEVTQVLLADCDFSDMLGINKPGVLFEQVHCWHDVFLQARLMGMRLFDCLLERCDFSAVDWEKAHLRRVEFLGCRLLGTNLSEAAIEEVAFNGCTADGAFFAMAKFKAARFERCRLHGAAFEGADLSGVVFHECDLAHADLRGAKLVGTDLSTSKIDGLEVGANDLQGAIIGPHQAVQVVGLLGVTIKIS
jgi:uncharacterized protein YjbI with pentapeptide repeats